MSTHPNPAGHYDIEPGDFYSNSWGYDQTNTDFYVVRTVSPSGKTVTIEQVGAILVESNGHQDQIRPTNHVHPRSKGPQRKTIQDSYREDQHYLAMEFGVATPHCAAESAWQTSLGMGH